MKTFSKLFTLFSKSKQTNQIMNISSSYYIPKINEIKDKDILNLVQFYLNEYTHKLTSKKLIFTRDLRPKYLIDKINMCTNIILNICIENELFAKHTFIPKKYLLLCAKLKYYENTILVSQKEILARLISLKHIYETKLISPPKRKLLKTLYESLFISYSIIEAQIFSIKSIIENYLEKIKLVEDSFDYDEHDKEIYELAKIILPDIYPKIIDSNIKDASKIVSLEIMLEQHIYQNWEFLKNLLLEDLESQNIEEKKENLLKKESILKALATYGRNLVNEQDIINFYEEKFIFLCKIVNEENINKYFNLTKLNIIEFQTYEKLIQVKIENLVKGTSKALQNIHNNVKIEFIKQAKKVLTLNGVFEVSYILSNYTLFNLLMCLDEEKGIEKFFATYKININELKPEFKDNNIVKTEDYISLNCLDFIKELLNNNIKTSVYNPSNTNNNLNENIYVLYLIWEKYQKSLLISENEPNTYQIPSGIVALNLATNPVSPFLNEILRKKIVVLPKGLIKFTCDEYNPNIILNDELQYLNVKKWLSENLVISPNLRKIVIEDSQNIRTIKFSDFRNSLLLKNNFDLFLLQFYSSTLKKREIYRENVKKHINMDLQSYRISKYDDYYNQYYYVPILYYEYSTLVNKIIFEDKGNSIVLDKDILNSVIEVDEVKSSGYSMEIKPKIAFREIVKKIEAFIKKESAYDLASKNNLPFARIYGRK